ncbi:protein bric-a-brac 1-like isoform X3 [Planococcus citri]|uniref:protein bric-a-brac 1-like isoform X3 n=1 Tax=Planococcus citri TaxID=170843 RepID=UPI0031F88474
MENSMIASSEGGDETQPAVGNNHSHSHSHGGGGPCGGGDEQTPQLFCLRWNNYQSNLTNVFDQLLQNESFVDVTLACADGHTVKAHKMVLSACSPYFQALFFENPCKHPIVILKDIKWTELKAAVEFMYKGEINVCQEQIAPLLKVAESLKIRGLADVSNEHDFAQRDSKSPTSAAETVARSPSRSNSSANSGQPPSKKRRRASADRSSTSTGEDTISVINSPSRALELVTSPSSSSIGTTSICNGMTSTHNASSTSCSQQQQQQQHQQQQSQSQAGRPSQSSTPQSPSNMAPLPIPPPPPTLPSTSSVADDMEIKPGIAEMIREEERAKMLESSQAWLNASTSLAYYVSAASASAAAAAVSTGTGATSAQNSNTASSGSCSGTGSLKLKVPTWTQAQLKEAIQAVVTQQMRFTQASTYFGIPKGTLYDNILGKTKRMQALEEAALSQEEETAVLEFCCQISESPYNRRTRKSLNEVLTFVQNLRQRKDPAFEFKGLSGFRWWWAFCKKHSIVSLHYSGTTPNNKGQDYDDQPYDFSTGRDSNPKTVPEKGASGNGAYSPLHLQQYLKLSVESSLTSFNTGNAVSAGGSTGGGSHSSGNFQIMQEIHAKTSPICH